MKHPIRFATVLAASLLGSLGSTTAEEPKRPWTDTAEVSFVSTKGNSQTSSFAATNKFVYNWTVADLTVDAGALRAESTTRLLSNPAGTVVVTEKTDTTAEAYNLSGKYRRTIREGFLWYVLGGWSRNRFVGIDSRAFVGGGAGYRFIKTDVHSLTGELGANYADENRVGGERASFSELRAFLGYERALGKTSKLTTDLELLENLKDTQDLRSKWVTSVVASLTKKLALKASYTVLYDRQPVEEKIAGPTPDLDAIYVHDELDTILAATLVLNF